MYQSSDRKAVYLNRLPKMANAIETPIESMIPECHVSAPSSRHEVRTTMKDVALWEHVNQASGKVNGIMFIRNVIEHEIYQPRITRVVCCASRSPIRQCVFIRPDNTQLAINSASLDHAHINTRVDKPVN